jgi:xylose isomerase
MTKFYSITDPIKYEGPDSKNVLAYRWYNPKQKVMGKTMAYSVLAGNRSVRQ